MSVRLGLPFLVLAFTFVCPSVPAAADLPPEQVEFFETKIRPVLVEHCYACHSAQADEIEGGLMLDNRAAMQKGGDSGMLLAAGDPGKSRLLAAIGYDNEELQMPPDGALPDEVLANFKKWIELGAPDPRDGAAPELRNIIAVRAARHWAFQPPKLVTRPVVKNNTWPTTDIDFMVLARLEKADLAPSSVADRYTLSRRLYFDLIGLPPTIDQIRTFIADKDPQAYTRLVNQLLDSEQFGERWARHWLDVARFGDTKGYVFTADRNYPNAYKYRDWVINAINDDMPYDRFLKLQLAADLIIPKDERTSLAALGFLTLGRRFINNKHDIIDDRIDVVFRGTMGLTVGCARCHDHKYDPLSTADYYAMYGIFQSSREQQDDDLPLRLVDRNRPANSPVFLRGNPLNHGDVVPRRYLSFFAGKQAKPFSQGSGRLELAEAIVDRNNPLTARVFVNRVWGHLFGAGLVRTPSDFGLRSEPPTHQDVLDHLAGSFMQDGWSVKRLIRTIVRSSVYRQRSDMTPAIAKGDPADSLLAHAQRRRLDFEAMRDAILAVSGQLDDAVGGESVKIEGNASSRRRTLYAFIDRQNLPGIFRTFDFASPDTHSPQRLRTTVPQQALFLMNNRFVHDAATALVKRLPSSGDHEQRIRNLYETVFARLPDADELAFGRRFVTATEPPAAVVPAGPWQFGYGNVDGEDTDGNQQVAVAFELLPYFTGDAWRGGPNLPDPDLGWAAVSRTGGHPGNDQQHASIRRWVAPRDGVIQIRGKLKHPADQGDGVRGRIVSSRTGVLAAWNVTHQEISTVVSKLDIRAGDTVDFIVDCRTDPSHDSFDWPVSIRLLKPAKVTASRRWDSRRGFHGPGPADLTVWQRYAQTLMLTNEFIMLD
jgi:hypothetical protein